jgi:2-polyprenyl-3-methyl-5-hydroxy-6-metoxy-1,4-benzoquinol methylase
MDRCLVCNGDYEESQYPGLLRCSSCGFITADVALSSAELKALYGEHYFCGEEYRDYSAERPTLKRHFRARLTQLLKYTPDARSRHLLEIGCAYGFFLELANDYFATVEGVDIASHAIRYANQHLNVVATEGDFLDYTPHNPIDVVCMWDTIEHLERPHAYVEKLARILPPGGIVALTTGDIGSIVARLRGSKWRQIHPPTHLHYFSRSTLTKLLQLRGFRVLYARSCGQYRTLDTMAYVTLVIRHSRPHLYQLLKKTGLLRFSLYLNLYDIMYVIAEKSG